MSSFDLQEGDIVVLKQPTEGSFLLESKWLKEDKLFVTALVTDLDGTFGIEVEFCEPVPAMSALGEDRPDHLEEPGSNFKFGDTKRWITKSEVISHYRPSP